MSTNSISRRPLINSTSLRAHYMAKSLQLVERLNAYTDVKTTGLNHTEQTDNAAQSTTTNTINPTISSSSSSRSSKSRHEIIEDNLNKIDLNSNAKSAAKSENAAPEREEKKEEEEVRNTFNDPEDVHMTTTTNETKEIGEVTAGDGNGEEEGGVKAATLNSSSESRRNLKEQLRVKVKSKPTLELIIKLTSLLLQIRDYANSTSVVAASSVYSPTSHVTPPPLPPPPKTAESIKKNHQHLKGEMGEMGERDEEEESEDKKAVTSPAHLDETTKDKEETPPLPPLTMPPANSIPYTTSFLPFCLHTLNESVADIKASLLEPSRHAKLLDDKVLVHVDHIKAMYHFNKLHAFKYSSQSANLNAATNLANTHAAFDTASYLDDLDLDNLDLDLHLGSCDDATPYSQHADANDNDHLGPGETDTSHFHKQQQQQHVDLMMCQQGEGDEAMAQAK